MSTQPATAPLAGVRVLDLSRQGPGPMCAQLLAELGAEVIAVEPVPVDERQAANKWLGHARRPVRTLGVDLKSKEGRELALAIARTSQIVLEGFRPGVVGRLGLAFEDLAAEGIEVVYVSISGYGQTGPLRVRPGHDINYVAYAGAISLVGAADGPPVAPGFLLADFAAGSLVAAVAALAALHDLRTTGRGQYVDISMVDAVAQTLARFLVPHLEGEAPSRRGGEFLTGAAPWYAIYETRDARYVSVGAVEPHFYAALCDGLELCEWGDSQWNLDAWPAMRSAFAEAFATRTQSEWEQVLGDACFAPVHSIDDVVSAEQLRERGVVRQTSVGPVVPVRGAVAADDAQPPERWREELFDELGYTTDTVASLRSRDVLRV